MRIILFVLILAVVVLIVAIGTDLVDIRQTRGAEAPEVSASNGISARGGQAPAFDIETGSVSVGTEQRNVAVPTVTVNPANEAAAVANNSTN